MDKAYAADWWEVYASEEDVAASPEDVIGKCNVVAKGHSGGMLHPQVCVCVCVCVRERERGREKRERERERDRERERERERERQRESTLVLLNGVVRMKRNVDKKPGLLSSQQL